VVHASCVCWCDAGFASVRMGRPGVGKMTGCAHAVVCWHSCCWAAAYVVGAHRDQDTPCFNQVPAEIALKIVSKIKVGCCVLSLLTHSECWGVGNVCKMPATCVIPAQHAMPPSYGVTPGQPLGAFFWFGVLQLDAAR
jgi:hypothetical protein